MTAPSGAATYLRVAVLRSPAGSQRGPSPRPHHRSTTMVIVMHKDAQGESVQRVIDEVTGLGFTPHVSDGEERTLIGAIGPAPTEELRERLAALPGVETVVRITKPYKLASREFKHDDSYVMIGGVKTGN